MPARSGRLLRSGTAEAERQRVLLGPDPDPQQEGIEHGEVTAVIHAVCTIGSAMPSTTTAT